LKILKAKKYIKVEGLFTHFSMAKDPNSRSYTNSQIKKFNIWRDAFLKAGFKPICHTSATSGTLLYKEAQYDMVRIGIGLYGIWPSDEARKLLSKNIKLEPVLSWKTIVAEVKKVTKSWKVLDSIFLAVVDNDSKHNLLQYNTDTGVITKLLEKEMEVYDISFASKTNTLLINGLDFETNKNVLGRLNMTTKKLNATPMTDAIKALSSF
jgi:hypothetical protein